MTLSQRNQTYALYQKAADYLAHTLTTSTEVTRDGPGDPFTIVLGIPSSHPWLDGSTIKLLKSRPGFTLLLPTDHDFFCKTRVAFTIDINKIKDTATRNSDYFQRLAGEVFVGIFKPIQPYNFPFDV